MTMEDLEGQWIQIGKTSVTVKNRKTGKTAGIVRDIRKIDEIPNNKMMDFYKKLNECGLFDGNVDSNHILVKDDEIYYLYSTKALNVEKECKDRGFNSSYDKTMGIINKVNATDGVTAIPVYTFCE